jgi:hypothetical protein
MLTRLQLRAALLDLCEDQLCWLESAEDAHRIVVAVRAAAPRALQFKITPPRAEGGLRLVREARPTLILAANNSTWQYATF